MSDPSAALSQRLLAGLSEQSKPLPDSVKPSRVRALSRQDLIELVRRIGAEEARVLREREEEIERRELANQQQLSDLQEELEEARERLGELEETQRSTARYELPRLAGLVDEERRRAEEAQQQAEELQAERDRLAAELERLRARQAEGLDERDFDDEHELVEELVEDDELPLDRGESHTMALTRAAAQLVAERESARHGSALDDDDLDDEALDDDDDDLDGEQAEALLDAGDDDAARAEALLSGDSGRAAREEPAQPRVEPPRAEEPERAELAAPQPRCEAPAAPREVELLRAEVELLHQDLASRELEIQQLRDMKGTMRLTRMDVGTERMSRLPPEVTNLDELLDAYADAEERAARIDVLEEVIWQLEAGKPSSEAWKRALDRLRRACAQEQAAREEAAQLLHEAEARRIELEDELRQAREASHQQRLELETLMVRYSSQESALERAQHELKAARLRLSQAEEIADEAGQAWSQAEDELLDVTKAREAQQAAEGALGRTREELRAARDLQERLRTELEKALAAREQATSELARAEQTKAEALLDLEEADLALQETELELAETQRQLEELSERFEQAQAQRAEAVSEARVQRRAAEGLTKALDAVEAEIAGPRAEPRAAGDEEADDEEEGEAAGESSPYAYARDGDVFHADEELDPLEVADPDDPLLAAARALLGQDAPEPSSGSLPALPPAAGVSSEEHLALPELPRGGTGIGGTDAALDEDSTGVFEAPDLPVEEDSLELASSTTQLIREDEERLAALEDELAATQAALSEAQAELISAQRALVEAEERALRDPLASLRAWAQSADELDPAQAQQVLLASEETLSRIERALVERFPEAAPPELPEVEEPEPELSAELAARDARIAELELALSEARAQPTTTASDEVETATLRARVAELEGQLSASAADAAPPARDAALQARVAELEGQLAEREEAVAGLESALMKRAGGDEVSQLQAALETARDRASEAETRARRLHEELATARGRVDDAEAAARSLRQQLEDREVALEHSAERAKSSEDELEAVRMVVAEQRRGLREARAVRSEHERDLETLGRELREQNRRLEELEAARAESERARESTEERLGELVTVAARRAEEVSDLRGRLEGSAQVAQSVTRERDTLRDELAAAKGRLEQLEAGLERAPAEAAERADLARERHALTGERDALAGERDALTGERDALTGERDALTGERDTLASEREQLLAERDELLAERDRLGQRLAALEDQLAELARAKAALEGELAAKEAELEQARAALAAAQTEAATARRERDELSAQLASASERAELLQLLEGEQGEALEAAAERASTLAGQVDELRAAQAELSRERDMLREAQDAGAEHLEALRGELAQANATLETARQDLRAAEDELEREQSERAQLDRLLATQREVQRNLEERLAALASGEADPGSELGEALSQARAERERLLRELTDAQARAAELDRERVELEARLGATSTDVLERPDLPQDADEGEVRSLRLLLREQEEMAKAMRSELVALQGQLAQRELYAPSDEDAAPAEVSAASDQELAARLAAIEEELAERDVRIKQQEAERQRLSEEVYDLGRLLESECWRGLATHRDLVKAQQRLRDLEEHGAPILQSSAAERLAEARRELVAEGAGGEADQEERQQAVHWLLEGAPQQAELLAEVTSFLPTLSARLRNAQGTLVDSRKDFQAERKSLLEELLTSERALQRAEEVGVSSDELNRKTRRATQRLGEFDSHLQVELRMLEDDMQVLEDARMWLLWELGDYSGQGERDEVNPEDAVVVHELRHELSDLRRRHEEEIRQRRQLERDAMQAMEDLERERSRLEQELGRRKGSEEQQAATRLRLEERLEELQSALDTNGGGSKSHHDEDFLRQAERIATLSWDLENRDSLVHWLLHELDPEVDEERRETQRLCAKEVRALREEMARDESPSPEEELTDPDLLHWLTAKPVVADS